MNLLDKQIPGRKRYRMIQNVLDQNNCVTHICRIKKNHYELIKNGEIIKRYRCRQSANRYLMKLYKKLKT